MLTLEITDFRQATGSLRQDVLRPSPANLPTSASKPRFLSAAVLERNSYNVAICFDVRCEDGTI